MYHNPKFTHPLTSADLYQSTKGVALGHIVRATTHTDMQRQKERETQTSAAWHDNGRALTRPLSAYGCHCARQVIYVSDLNRSIRFYSELLGFELRVRHGVYWAELAAGTTTLALRLAQPNSAAATETKEPTAGSASASFFVKDLKSFHARALEFDGCKVVKEPVQQPWGGFQAHYADPDGLGFTVVELPSL